MVSKLRRDVFRHVLDYQFPKVLCWRYTDCCWPLSEFAINEMMNKHFPATENLDFDNYVVAVSEIPGLRVF